MLKLKSLFVSALLALATACALTSTPSLVVAPVGPAPETNPKAPRPPATGDGYLEVFSVKRSYVSEREVYWVHTAYGVYAEDGTRLKSVQNAISLNSPEPQVVPLAPGTYNIQAWADGLILVRVPVVIQPGRLTTVNLETGNKSLGDKAKPEELVRLPDGRVVGWSATAAGAH